MNSKEARTFLTEKQNPYLTAEEFGTLLKHTEVVIDPYAFAQGDLERLADSPIEEGGEPVKKFLIYLNPKTTGKEQALAYLRMLSNVKRNLLAPINYPTLSELELEEKRIEEGIERLYDEHPELLSKVSTRDNVPLSNLIM